MGCSVRPIVQVLSVSANSDTSGSGVLGLFNPFGGLVPTSEFTALRATVEVLAVTGDDMEFDFGFRTTDDGVTWTSYFHLSDLGPPYDWLDSEEGPGWHFSRFGQGGSIDHMYMQFGIWGRRKSGSARPVVTLRVMVDFKNSLVPQSS